MQTQGINSIKNNSDGHPEPDCRRQCLGLWEWYGHECRASEWEEGRRVECMEPLPCHWDSPTEALAAGQCGWQPWRIILLPTLISSLTHRQWSHQHLHWWPDRGLREDVYTRPLQRLDLLHLGRGVRGVWPHLPPPNLPAGPHGRVQLWLSLQQVRIRITLTQIRRGFKISKQRNGRGEYIFQYTSFSKVSISKSCVQIGIVRE